MKLKLIISLCFIFLTCLATSGLCKPELVCMENDVEKRVDGIEGTMLFYIEAGEKKFFPQKNEFFIKKNDSELLSSCFVPVNYVVKDNENGSPRAVVTITAGSSQSTWNKIQADSLFKLWSEEFIQPAICFVCWYEPDSDLLRISGFRKLRYFEGEFAGAEFGVDIESVEQEGFPVVFMWNNGGPVPPNHLSSDSENIFRSIISGDVATLENGGTAGSLYDCEDVLGNRAIHYAAALGRAELLKQFLANGADVNAETAYGMTPLLLAVSAGRKNIVDVLLQYNADVKCMDVDKRTPLHYAAYRGDTAIVQKLLEHHPGVNKKDEFGHSPAIYAINEGNDSVVGLLADGKAKIRSDQENLQGSLVAQVSSENYHIVSFLLDQKAKADMEIYGTTPLIVAAANSSVEMVDLLIERGANVDKANQNQITPLLSACLTGRLEVVKYLLDKNAKVDAKSKSGLTVLQAAVIRDDPEMIGLLASHGVDIDEKDESGKTAFWQAAVLGHRESMDKLLEVGVTCNLNMKNAIGLMELAFRYNMPKAVSLALGQCLDANFLFYNKYPSTWVADYYGDDEILDLLIGAGAEKTTGEDLGIVSAENLSETPSILEYTSIYYPMELKRKYGARKFLVQVLINDQGEVLFPKMVDSGIPELEKIVIETVTTWRFKPPKNSSGQACTTIANLPIALECEDIEKNTWEISGSDQPPKVLKSFPPKYPLELARKKIQGRVVLRMIIDETGKPEEISIFSMTHKGFAEAAIAAGKKYEFRPAYYHGKPVKVVVRLPVVFELD